MEDEDGTEAGVSVWIGHRWLQVQVMVLKKKQETSS
jgi:hypothetical protein